MASAPACAAKVGVELSKLAEVPDDHPVWDYEAWYLAHLCTTTTLLMSPHVIVLGGGVLHRQCLFDKIRKLVKEFLNGYIQADKIINHIDEYIVPSIFNAPGSKTTAGAVGALYIGQIALESMPSTAVCTAYKPFNTSSSSTSTSASTSTSSTAPAGALGGKKTGFNRLQEDVLGPAPN